MAQDMSTDAAAAQEIARESVWITSALHFYYGAHVLENPAG
jgi:hypothetical protein